MARFIEEFYYGNIDPQARSIKQNKTVQKEMAILSETEEQLTNALQDEQKKWFLDFSNAWSVVNGEPILIASLWDSAWEQTLPTMRSSPPRHRLKIY